MQEKIQHRVARRSENVNQSNGEFFIVIKDKKAVLDYKISGKQMCGGLGDNFK